MPETINATVTKQAESDRVGIRLVSGVGGKIFVDTTTGLFGETALKEGDEVILVNGTVVEGMAVSEVIAMLRTSVGEVTILAKRDAAGGASGGGGPPPPPGKAPAGGVWGTLKYSGAETQRNACIGCLCCGVPGLCILACPTDEKDAYAVDNKVYDAAGTYIGPQTNRFTPKANVMNR